MERSRNDKIEEQAKEREEYVKKLQRMERERIADERKLERAVEDGSVRRHRHCSVCGPGACSLHSRCAMAPARLLLGGTGAASEEGGQPGDYDSGVPRVYSSSVLRDASTTCSPPLPVCPHLVVAAFFFSFLFPTPAADGAESAAHLTEPDTAPWRLCDGRGPGSCHANELERVRWC